MIQPLPKPRLRDRSTGDLLVLIVAGTVCGITIGVTASLVVGNLINPNSDQSGPASAIGDVVNTLIGLLAGFLAGRSDTALTVSKTETRVREEERKKNGG